MGLAIVTGAVQTFHGSSSIFANSTDLFKRVVSAALVQLKSLSFSEGPIGANFSESLASRVVILSAFVLSASTFLLRYRAYPTETKEREVIVNNFFFRTGILVGAWATGSHFIAAALALNSFIQLKNAYFVLPYLDNLLPSPSLIDRACQAAYPPIKYASLTAIAIGVFQSCNRSLSYGALFLAMAYIPYELTDFVSRVKVLQNTTLTKIELEVGKSIGTYVASGLLLCAVLSGIVGSIVFTRGSTLISGIANQKLYSFFDGLMDISLVFGVAFPFIKIIRHFNNLDQYTTQFIKRFSFTVAQADLLTNGEKLPKSYFAESYRLALAYIVKKADPAQSQEIIQELKKLPANGKLIHFFENLPFFDAQETKEYIETCEMEIKDVQYYFNPEQVEQILLPPNFTRLNDKTIEAELESLEIDLEDAVKNCAGLTDESLLIYEKIHTKHKKIAEYSSSLETIVYLLNEMDLDRFINSETKAYIRVLQESLPAISSLKQKIKALEDKIENRTGDLTQPAVEAIGEKGLRVSDCNEILTTLEQPSSVVPFKELSRLLAERGIQNKYDLIQKEILLTQDSTDELKVRLLDFLAPASSGTYKAFRLANKTYNYALKAFFIGLQLYTQPKWSAAGLVWGIVGSSFFPNNPISRFLESDDWILYAQRRVLQNMSGVQRKSLEITIISARVLLLLSPVGFVSAFINGSSLSRTGVTFLP